MTNLRILVLPVVLGLLASTHCSPDSGIETGNGFHPIFTDSNNQPSNQFDIEAGIVFHAKNVELEVSPATWFLPAGIACEVLSPYVCQTDDKLAVVDRRLFLNAASGVLTDSGGVEFSPRDLPSLAYRNLALGISQDGDYSVRITGQLSRPDGNQFDVAIESLFNNYIELVFVNNAMEVVAGDIGVRLTLPVGSWLQTSALSLCLASLTEDETGVSRIDDTTCPGMKAELESEFEIFSLLSAYTEDSNE